MRAATVPALLLAATLLTGCAAIKGAEPPPDTLRLAPRAAAAAGPRRPGGVTVDPVAASGLAGTRRYTYVLAGEPLLPRQAATLFWEVPPAETLTAALGAALATRFAGPTGPTHLIARLVRFEEVSGDGPARAVVALDATLTGTAIDATLTGGGTARYCRATPIAAPGSQGRAAAFQSSIESLATAVATDTAAGALASSDC